MLTRIIPDLPIQQNAILMEPAPDGLQAQVYQLQDQVRALTEQNVLMLQGLGVAFALLNQPGVLAIADATIDSAAIGSSSPATGVFTTMAATSLAGYATGAGGAVTQLTNKSTTVTLNKGCGQITTHNAALASGARVAFSVNDSLVAATDTVIANVANVGALGTNNYAVTVNSVVAGVFVLGLENISAGALSEAVVINFAVIKATAA